LNEESIHGKYSHTRFNAKPSDLTVHYYDGDAALCACYADGIAIATYVPVGRRL
jgi:hypothetical protein